MEGENREEEGMETIVEWDWGEMYVGITGDREKVDWLGAISKTCLG